MIEYKKIGFSNTQRDFTTTLNKRVNDYFHSNKISRYANSEMVFKTIFMFALHFIPFALIITQTVEGTFATILMILLMSFGLAGIGLSVMHDGNHGAYSNKSWINNLLGYSLNLVGASAFSWKMQHNVLHHTYTNVHEQDEDIDSRGALRLTPHTEWKWFHKYQFIYAWLLYGLMTLLWMFVKDFERLARYERNGMLKRQQANPPREWTILIITKIVYISYIFILPLLITPWAWWQIIIGMVIMHYITGFLLAIIFQPAHVIEGTEFPLPDEKDTLENNWAIHQLHTTTNFGNKSRLFSWYVGGLNFQIEHHLFPNVCHVHYRKIAKIVKATAEEFELPYKSVETFRQALKGHLRLLKQLGQKPEAVADEIPEYAMSEAV
jgi:linoleoyl-CoA desaturase